MKTTVFMTRLRTWLNDIPVRDAIDRRMASLLQVMLLGFMSILVTATIISLFLAPATVSRQEKLIYNAVFLFVVWIPFFLLRRGYFRSSVFTIIVAFIALETYNIIYSDLRPIAETLSLLTLAILLAGLLIGRKALAVTFVFSIAAVLIGVFRQHDPALKLDGVAIAGNFILVNGLMSLFLGRFDRILRTALKDALEREAELKNEIAERERAEQEREVLIHKLEGEIEHRHRLQDEREKYIGELNKKNAELERFTYTVSHDLRNPLVTIRGFIGMLNKDIQENRPERVQHDMQRIAGATDKMDSLLSELLELSRIGRIVNPYEDIDLLRLIQDALELLDGQIRMSGFRVNIVTELPSIYGDRVRLLEVFENLISNAVKYKGNQSSPVIDIGIRSAADGQVVFVRDNGMGIEERYHTRIFGLFEKLDPTMDGTGIGLALVKRIIETHNGMVWVESEGLGKGSTFCFTIPDGRK